MAEGRDAARVRVVVMGAAGRDFHVFNVVYRDDPRFEVIAFTATQIPGIAGRRYPAALAGLRYPDGIPIVDEGELDALCRRERVDRVVFAYSDVSHLEVMRAGSRALAAGADFVLHGPRRTMLRARRPVVAVCASRTGAGKSPTTRRVAGRLRELGLRVAVVRHPMPYRDLVAARVRRFARRADLDVAEVAAEITAEEREEFEPLLDAGHVAFEGVDYAAVLEAAERDGDVIVWDGGNNDFAFVVPDLAIALVDALRVGDVTTYHPGETVVRTADVAVVTKVDSASSEQVHAATEVIRALNPQATVLRAALPVRLDDPEAVRGRRVIVVEDGPTVTHGGMPYGAGFVAAIAAHAHVIVDPRDSAPPALAAVYARWPHLGRVLPAVGYTPEQLEALRRTINDSDAEVVVSATPCDVAALVPIARPVVRARYAYADAGEPTLDAIVDAFVARRVRAAPA